jgi:hypothetical protein
VDGVDDLVTEPAGLLRRLYQEFVRRSVSPRRDPGRVGRVRIRVGLGDLIILGRGFEPHRPTFPATPACVPVHNVAQSRTKVSQARCITKARPRIRGPSAVCRAC